MSDAAREKGLGSAAVDAGPAIVIPVVRRQCGESQLGAAPSAAFEQVACSSLFRPASAALPGKRALWHVAGGLQSARGWTTSTSVLLSRRLRGTVARLSHFCVAF